VVSAGGTREAIDPVRVISNRSSGRQGIALAEVAARLGADVTLVSTVSTPLALDVVNAIGVIRVESAAEMHEAMLKLSGESDVVVMAAAVSDFTLTPSNVKLKKRDGIPDLQLVPATDIVRDLVAQRHDGQLIVGFAAETTDVAENAAAKLREKDVDLLIANDVAAPGVGFGHETNEVVIFAREGTPERVSLRSKEAVAYEILARVAALLPQGAQ
jgi:phosphopantothenoylcysteine decarboxylase/phosphopantothenate--cysteine ligase